MFRASRVALAAAAAATAVLALPASAAGFSGSRVTAPPDGFHTVVANSPGELEVRFEVDGRQAGDRADVWCIVVRSAARRLAQDVEVAGGTTAVNVRLADFRPGTCLILAVPAGTDVETADLGAYRGPIVTTDWRQTYTTEPGHASGNVQYDYFVSQQQARGYGDYYGISSCGVCDTSLLYADSRRASEFMFWGNAWLDITEPSPRARSHLRIDGHNAWGSYVARLDLDPTPGNAPGSTLPGVPPLTVTATGERGQDLVVDEAQDTVRCENGDPWPVTSVGCGRFVGTGVRIERRIRQTRDGTLVYVVDVFRSTDGREHQLDLHWLNAFRDPPGPPEPSHQFPWAGDAYAVHEGDDRVAAPPGAPFTLFARANHHAADGTRPWPQGAIVFDTPAGALEYLSPTEFIVPMGLTVPAAGAVTVRQALVTAETRVEAAEVALRVEDEYVVPTIAIAAPAEGASVTRSPVEVTGTAGDNKGVALLTVNGARATIGSDGRWSARVELQPGLNTVTAIATDAAGGQATAVRTVDYAPPPPDDTPPVLAAVRLAPKAFRPARTAAARRGGTRVRYRLSEAATVRFEIARPVRGRRAGGKCRPATRRLRSRPRCTRLKRVGAITRRSPAGRSRVRFTGRLRGRALRRGAYRMLIRATDAAGNRSRTRSLRFRIVRRR